MESAAPLTASAVSDGVDAHLLADLDAGSGLGDLPQLDATDDQPGQLQEGSLHLGVLLCADLQPLEAVLVSELAPLGGRDLSLGLQVALVA
jgi:hypothetical protein